MASCFPDVKLLVNEVPIYRAIVLRHPADHPECCLFYLMSGMV